MRNGSGRWYKRLTIHCCLYHVLGTPEVYSYLERLGEQVLYYDTDSVIYKWRDGQTSIPTGDFLGEMTDELDGDAIKR